MQESKISVIIPVYNVEEYINECLESVLNQTYKNIEILCIDDCGIDNSVRKVECYAKKDSRIKILRHNCNKGLACSRNTGIKYATGDYIFFLDSDDYITEDILEKMYNKAITTNSDVIVSTTKVFNENPSNSFLQERVNAVENYLKFVPVDNYQVSATNFSEALKIISCVSWGKLYKSSFIKKNNLKYTNKNLIHEDDGFSLKVLSCLPNVTMVDNVGVMYRIREKSITYKIENKGERKKKFKNMKSSLEDAFKFIKKSNTKEQSDLIIKIVKNSELYYTYFLEKFNKFGIKITWGNTNKKISIMGITLYSQKIKNVTTVFKILGIPLKKKSFNNDTKITIIVPFYNTISNYGSDKYLMQNLKSLITQTYNNIEILYIDNNSSDNSKIFIKKYAQSDNRIKILEETKQGVVHARNLGIKNATGQYITFIDSDDSVSLDFIETFVKNKKVKNSDVVIRNFLLVQDGKVSNKTHRCKGIKKYGKNIKNVYPYIECPHNIFFNTDFIRANNIKYKPDIEIGEDNLFNVSALLQAKKVVFLDEDTYFYNVINKSSSNISSNKFISFIDAYDEIFKLGLKKWGYVNNACVKYFLTKYYDFLPYVIDKKLYKQKSIIFLKNYEKNFKLNLRNRNEVEKFFKI